MSTWRVSQKRKSKRIENGEFYIVIQAMNQGDRDEMLDVMVKMDVAKLDKEKLKQKDTSGAQMALGSMRAFQRIRSIKEWNLRYWDEDKQEYGDPIPLTAQGISDLPPEIIAEIDAVIAELNPQLDDSKKN